MIVVTSGSSFIGSNFILDCFDRFDEELINIFHHQLPKKKLLYNHYYHCSDFKRKENDPLKVKPHYTQEHKLNSITIITQVF